MTAISEYLQTLYELFKILILVGLFSIAGISFPVDANAAGKEGEAGGIVIGRDVPQGSAIRPSIVPGRANVVDTSPDDIVINAVGAEKSNNRMASLNELSEEDFAAITTDSPLRHLSSQINADGFAGAGSGSNVMQSTAGISNTLVGSSGTISNSVNRATSSIGQTMSGATGFLK